MKKMIDPKHSLIDRTLQTHIQDLVSDIIELKLPQEQHNQLHFNWPRSS
jgi:hypothetical protein